MKFSQSVILFASISTAAVGAHGRSRATTSRAAAAPLAELARCKAIADGGERLSCYDRATSALLKAEQSDAIIVVDAEEVKQARKSRFGLGDIDLPLLHRHGAPVAPLTQIEGKIVSAATDASGQWMFDLGDAGVWQQIDTLELGRSPRPGDPVVIRRAALGSFRLSVAKTPAVRVRRLR